MPHPFRILICKQGFRIVRRKVNQINLSYKAFLPDANMQYGISQSLLSGRLAAAMDWPTRRM